jgi:hypothetical protein
MRARYYHPRLMRFLNADPIGFAGGMNWYAFADNDPISRFDPLGLKDTAGHNELSVASLAGSTYVEVGEQVLSSFEQGWFLADRHLLKPWENAMGLAADGAQWVGDRILPGSGPGFRNLAIAAMIFGGRGKFAPAKGIRTFAAAENAAPAFSRLSPGGGLMASENAGGHLLARHVGQTEAQLAARLSAQPNISAASSFATRAQAEAAVSAAFDANAARVAAWTSSGASGRLTLNAAFSGGTVMQRGAAAATQGTGVRVILQGNGSGGYHVLTGFPTP